MANLKTMYKGVVNSPDTYLKETLAQGATVMYVMDGSVFGTLPTLAVIGENQAVETVLVKSKRSDGGFDIQRGFEGIDKKWEKAAAVARNFTNYDYQTLVDNLNTLNNDKVEKSGNKVLSDNNYTNADKAKVNAIPTNPKYTDTTYDLSPYAKKTEIKTKLSEMVGDSNNRTVTDAEKKSWNSKASKSDIKTKLSEMTDDKLHKTVSEDDINNWNKLTENLTVISSNADTNGLYKTVEYKNKAGSLVYKTELIGSGPKYSQIKLTEYEGSSVKATQVWNLTYDGNDFVYKKEMI